MAKAPKANESGIELKRDGWNQFERAIDAAVKGGPKHKAAPPKRTAGKGRARVGKAKG